MINISHNEELVEILVPKRHLSKIYAYVGQLDEDGAPVSSSLDEEETGPWTAELLRKAYAESAKPMKAVLKHMAERPGEMIPTADLAQIYGQARGRPATPKNLAGAMGALGRRIANRYNIKGSNGRSIRPWYSHWEPTVGSVVYQMPEPNARVLASI